MNERSMRSKASAAKRRNPKAVAAPGIRPIVQMASQDEAAVAEPGDAASVALSASSLQPPAANHAKAVKAEKPEKPDKAAKAGEAVTYSVTVTGDEARRVEALRAQYRRDGVKPKKSVVLRAALHALADIDPARLEKIVAQAAEEHARAKPRKTRKKGEKK